MNNHLYLAHHGIKGMKWGVRRFQNPDGTLTAAGKKRYSEVDLLTYEGSNKTQRLTNKMLKTDKRFGNQRTVAQQTKLNRQFKNINSSYEKDIAKAASVGNDSVVRRLNAGRTYLKVLSDPVFFNSAISDAAVRAGAEVGKDFTYNILRDEDFGGIAITVNGVTNRYRYVNYGS